MRESAAAKARRYLTEGRLIIQRVDIGRVSAQCRGDGTVYRQRFQWGRWECDCPARSDACAHLIAVRLVTAVDLEATQRHGVA